MTALLSPAVDPDLSFYHALAAVFYVLAGACAAIAGYLYWKHHRK